MNKDSKAIYAQSSDIKARTYLEYRKDMKKKAIAEYEIIDWLALKLSKIYQTKVIIKKSSGDKNIWFLRKGGITGKADYQAIYPSGEEDFLEFQYSERKDLQYFDFKVSKVGKKKNGKRIPFENKKFIYIIKPTLEYAIFSPKWIMENGFEGPVPAWGSRIAYRVPHDIFVKLFNKDTELESVISVIDKKNYILEFQHHQLDNWKNELSNLLQNVIDNNKLTEFIPGKLNTFFKICFILDYLQKIPENTNLWLIYSLSFLDNIIKLKDLAKLMFSIDFLYSKIDLTKKEISVLVNSVNKIYNILEKFSKDNGIYQSSWDEKPIEELRYALFSINILEDLVQDLIVNYNAKLKPIKKIYQTIKNIDKTYEVIHGNK